MFWLLYVFLGSELHAVYIIVLANMRILSDNVSISHQAFKAQQI